MRGRYITCYCLCKYRFYCFYITINISVSRALIKKYGNELYKNKMKHNEIYSNFYCNCFICSYEISNLYHYILMYKFAEI